MKYRVIVMPVAEAAINRHIAYLLNERRSPQAASRVLQRIDDAIDKLQTFPHAGGRPPEADHRDYLIRFRLVDRCLLLYTVDDAKRTVAVIGFRHGAQQPRPQDLPGDVT